MKKNDLSLYIHIPFCVRKCLYCDFLSGPADARGRDAYMQALLLELESYRNHPLAKRNITTVFIGGGTPSLLTEEQIEALFAKLKDVFFLEEDCEITIEMNPGTVTKQKIDCYLKVGINRFSIGLQSPHDALLKTLGRIHTYKQFLETYHMLRAAGADNINIDLMSALPGQTVQMYCEGLRKVLELSPEHISAYSLIVEEGTPFYEKYNNKCNDLPGEEEDRLMYECTGEILHDAGYERYEISNYAKEGFSSRHNSVYWERGEYLGIGLGSASFTDRCRYKNTSNLKEYIDAWNAGNGASVQRMEEERLTGEDEMEEFMFLGLRMMKGVSGEKFCEQFGVMPEEVFGSEIEKLIQQRLIQRDVESGRISLTKSGIDVSNYVFEHFLL
nr:oxygen-independent coproporphyrinogen III oxidase [Lachnospiraceae bacterium]